MQELLRLGLPAEHDAGSHPGLILLFAPFCLDALDWASRPMSPKAHGEIGARRAEAEARRVAEAKKEAAVDLKVVTKDFRDGTLPAGARVLGAMEDSTAVILATAMPSINAALGTPSARRTSHSSDSPPKQLGALIKRTVA